MLFADVNLKKLTHEYDESNFQMYLLLQIQKNKTLTVFFIKGSSDSIILL